MEISAPSAQRQQIAEIEKQTKEQSQVNIILEFYFTLLGKGLLASNTDFLISIPFQPDGGWSF